MPTPVRRGVRNDWFGRKESNLRAIDSESMRLSRARPNDSRLRRTDSNRRRQLQRLSCRLGPPERLRSAVRESNSPLRFGRPGPKPLDQPHEVPPAGVEPAPNRLKAGCSPLSDSGIGARRGDRTHLQQIKNLLPHQSAWRAWSSREIPRARSSHIDYSIFKVAITRR